MIVYTMFTPMELLTQTSTLRSSTVLDVLNVSDSKKQTIIKMSDVVIVECEEESEATYIV